MSQGLEAEPSIIADNYLELNCPTTGRPCPSRVNISNLCAISYEDGDLPEDYLEETLNDSRKRAMFLLAHTGLIKLYGCDGEVSNMCPPSVASNSQPMVHGTKQRIKKWLKG